MMKTKFLAFIFLVLLASTAEAANKCVDPVLGSDSNSYASNDGTNNCWETLGRSFWGSSNRATPSADEAAGADDVVYVATGTYDFSGTIGNNSDWVYDPVHTGTSGHPIRWVCTGQCTLTGNAANAQFVGGGGNYLEFWADVTQGHKWILTICADEPGGADGCTGAVAAANPDRTPVTLNGTGNKIEGFEITGFGPVVFSIGDNWNGVRFQSCVGCSVRFVQVSNIYRNNSSGVDATNHNQSCVTLYGSRDAVMEYITCFDAGAGIYWKDQGSISGVQENNIIRYSIFYNLGECFAWSHLSPNNPDETTTHEGRNYVYQNICRDSDQGATMIGGVNVDDGAVGDWVVNNTFQNISLQCFGPNTGPLSQSTGIRFYNNICRTAGYAIFLENQTMEEAATVSMQHNDYSDVSTFYTGSDGAKTFANYKLAYTDQDVDDPDSVTSDPAFADELGNDFRLCTGSGVPTANCSGASSVIALGVDILDLDDDASTVDAVPAGAYITNEECFGYSCDPTEPPPDPDPGPSDPVNCCIRLRRNDLAAGLN